MCSIENHRVVELEKQIKELQERIKRYEYAIKLWQNHDTMRMSKAMSQRLSFSNNVLLDLAGCPMEFIKGRYNIIMKLYDTEREMINYGDV